MKKTIVWIVLLLVNFGLWIIERFTRILNWLWMFSRRFEEKLEKIQQRDEQRERNRKNGFDWEEQMRKKWYNPIRIWRNLPNIGAAIIFCLMFGLGAATRYFREKIFSIFRRPKLK